MTQGKCQQPTTNKKEIIVIFHNTLDSLSELHSILPYKKSHSAILVYDLTVPIKSSITARMVVASKKNGKSKSNSAAKRRPRSDSSSSSEDSSDSADSDRSDSDSSQEQQKQKKRTVPLSKNELRESLRLDPPKFALPQLNNNNNNNNENQKKKATNGIHNKDDETFDSNRYELWSFRLPSSIPVEDLDGREFTIPVVSSAVTAGGTVFAPGHENEGSDNNNNNNNNNNNSAQPCAFVSKNSSTLNCSLRWGHQVENESFRVLVPQNTNENNDATSNGDNDDDNNNKVKFLAPANVAFQRHINVVSAVEDVSETKLAPGQATAPKVDLVTRGVQHEMRRAYQPVPQKTGLQRRWMPLGSKGGADVAAEAARPRSMSASSQLLYESQLNRKRKTTETTAQVKQEENKRKRPNSQTSSAGFAAAATAAASVQKRPKKEKNLSEDDSSNSNNNSKSKKETKAEKKARKEQKKAKKEAKKAKKEAKKTKKEKKVKMES